MYFTMYAFIHISYCALDINIKFAYQMKVKEYVEDPLIWQGGLKARWIYELGIAMTEARTNMHLIKLPLFIMHGDQDILVPISASQFIQSNVGSQDLQYEVSVRFKF